MQSQRHASNELTYSLFVIIVLTGVYVAYDLLAEPRGGHPFGHWLGAIGATLMLMTEVLYSVRKRTNWLNGAGPVRNWLSFHIFTGLVGPFLVLMHTGLVFRGIAGITALLTLIVVASGFVGRYVYRNAPHLLRYWHIIHVPLGLTLFASIAIHVIATIYFGASFPP
jgi:hypothetical protein